MIPILYKAVEKDFTSNGLGGLPDCISCTVTEERNGIYELELKYHITGLHYDSIEEGNFIVASHDEQGDRQPFVIYRISRPISGVVTVNAYHVSYLLSGVIVSPFTATTVSGALNKLSTNAMTENPFTFWTDKTSSGNMKNEVPTSAKSLLGGTEGSILDSFGGGDYEFDWYTVKLYANRGSDNGVTIRYGKNLTDITADRDTLDLYNAVIPYWKDSEGNVVYGNAVIANGGIQKTEYWTDENDEWMLTDDDIYVLEFQYYLRKTVSLDLSGEFDEQPTKSQLETKAAAIMANNSPWLPRENIKIDFVALWQTEEYKNIAPIEQIQLCDYVHVIYPELGVRVKTKVVKVVWDVILEKYSSIELGEKKASFLGYIEHAPRI